MDEKIDKSLPIDAIETSSVKSSELDEVLEPEKKNKTKTLDEQNQNSEQNVQIPIDNEISKKTQKTEAPQISSNDNDATNQDSKNELNVKDKSSEDAVLNEQNNKNISNAIADLGDDFRLLYDKSSLQLLVRVNYQLILDNNQFSDQLFQKVQSKVDHELNSLNVADFILHTNNFTMLWERVKDKKYYYIPKSTALEIVLADGIPFLDCFEIIKTKEDKELCRINIDFTFLDLEEMKRIPFLNIINLFIKESGIKGFANQAQLNSLYLSLKGGEQISSVSIQHAPSMNLKKSLGEGSDYIILSQNNDIEVCLIIFDIECFRIEEEIDNAIISVKDRLAELGGGYILLENLIRSEIKRAVVGVQAFGLNLPLNILAARKEGDISYFLELEKEEDEEEEDDDESKFDEEELPDDYSGRGLIDVVLTPDRAQAKIINFNMDYYEDESLKLDHIWLSREILRMGLLKPNALIKGKVLSALRSKKDINELVVSEGFPAIQPAHPEIIAQKEEAPTGENLFRDRLLEKFVRADTHVAELIYTVKGRVGKDVYGAQIPIPPPEAFQVNFGEGVEPRGETSYFSTVDGMLEIDGDSISITETYVHPGDVNLASGDIVFDGPVIVDGSLDTGSRLFAGGEVLVKGDIRNGYVICDGDLICGGGVITSEKGYVRTKGNLECDFIENSIVFCSGDIKVVRAILSSDIYAAKNIYLDPDRGTLAGGRIYIWERVVTGNLGFRSGAPTRVFMGSNWRHEYSINTQKKRLAHMEEELSRARQEIVEFERKRLNQMSEKLKKQKSAMRKS